MLMYTSSWIVDDIRSGSSNNEAVVCFYASHGRQSYQSVPSFLSFLARQLICQRPEAEFGAAADAVSSYLQQRDCRSRDKLHGFVCDFARSYDIIYCIVDALDEFSPGYDERVDFVKCLTRLRSDFGEGRLLICLTSRDSSGIHDILHPAITLRIKTPMTEMKAYINERIQRSTFLSKSTKGDSALRTTLVDIILQKSDLM